MENIIERKLIYHLLSQMEDVQRNQLWMGVNYRNRLDELDEEVIFRQPKPTFQSVGQLIAHLTFWRKDAIVKIETGRGSVRDSHPDNFPDNEALKAIGWEAIKRDHDQVLQDVMQCIASKDDAWLSQTYYDLDFQDYFPYDFIVTGLVHHDIYHLGQISLVLKMLRSA